MIDVNALISRIEHALALDAAELPDAVKEACSALRTMEAELLRMARQAQETRALARYGYASIRCSCPPSAPVQGSAKCPVHPPELWPVLPLKTA